MKRLLGVFVLCGMAACASSRGQEATIVKKPHPRLAKAGILPGQSLPAEREGVRLEDTGAIMFICAETDRHEDKEVFLSKCPSCSDVNYFYWDHASGGFACYACTKPVESGYVKCPDCGRSPRMVRTRPKPNKPQGSND